MKNLLKTSLLLAAVVFVIGTVRMICSFCDVAAMIARYNGGKYDVSNK